jgi:hypothetical protein
MITGSCLCGAIRFEIDAPITAISHCHCGMCRKMHGAAFATFGSVEREHLHWLSGTEHRQTYGSSARLEREFCSRCGSSLLCRSDDEPGVDYIALGTLDGDPGVRPEYHIWVDSKAPWYEITDELPRYAESD